MELVILLSHLSNACQFGVLAAPVDLMLMDAIVVLRQAAAMASILNSRDPQHFVRMAAAARHTHCRWLIIILLISHHLKLKSGTWVKSSRFYPNKIR